MNKARRKWLMAAGVFLGVAAGSARAQQLEIPAPAPKSLPAFVQPPKPNQPNQAQAPANGGHEIPPASSHDRKGPWCRDCFLGYEEQFEALPLGYVVHQHFQTQVNNGEAARMVLYQYDFHGPMLNVRGKDQLARIAAMTDHNFFPIVIERTPCNPALAEARRLNVLNELANAPFPIPPARVVIGPPLSNGLWGVEAEIIYRNMLRQTQAGGAPITGLGGAAVGGLGGGVGGGVGGPGGSLGTTNPSTPTLP